MEKCSIFLLHREQKLQWASCLLQYPVAENGFEFQESLVEALYGIGIWDRLRALVNVLKMLTEQHPGGGGKRRND